MSNWLEIPTLAILSLNRRRDRRNVAVCSALWGGFDIRHTRFFDAKDAKDYKSVDYLLKEAIEDEFPEFEALWGYPGPKDELSEQEQRMGFAPVAYAWSLCRYFRYLERVDQPEFFMHDDMYGRPFKHFHVNQLMLIHIHNSSILKQFCHVKNIDFGCLLLNTQSKGLCSVQPYVFEVVVAGTYCLNLKAGLYSPYGASLILERLRHQISLGIRTPKAFLETLESMTGWNPPGVFSTTEPLFLEFSDNFLGSDIRGVPPLQGPLGKLFSEIKPS